MMSRAAFKAHFASMAFWFWAALVVVLIGGVIHAVMQLMKPSEQAALDLLLQEIDISIQAQRGDWLLANKPAENCSGTIRYYGEGWPFAMENGNFSCLAQYRLLADKNGQFFGEAVQLRAQSANPLAPGLLCEFGLISQYVLQIFWKNEEFSFVLKATH
ncbi:hypothetical protein VST7929_02406 [Vibrio stylophorae]|uniref:MSHA biogenesis protein MshF n=1 Tax=Vibrio stylophorae TaxID=659351 RepID=A0ABM8ZW69_9VIBR|nr:hypothetical protein [Vibrio stylophorae]CAH0534473.1 hypothetical protein VST7929_02406 [Vibrio stylophorae]